MNEPDSAIVFYRERIAGVLKKTPAGFEFTYDPDYLKDPEAAPVSLSMPLKSEKFESPALFPFFDGLLPEGWLLDVVSTGLKIDKHDKFKLLLRTGRDPIGAVSVQPFGELPHV
jgi:serine/threonine-protein kinase HipA